MRSALLHDPKLTFFCPTPTCRHVTGFGNVTQRGQIPIDFQPGLTQRYRRLEDVIANTVHQHRLGVDGVAGKIDMGGSELGRRLSAHLEQKAGEANNRPLRVADMVAVLETTEDFEPIYWLIERFLQDPSVKRDRAIHQLASLVPQIIELAQQAGVPIAAAQRRKA